MKIWNQAQLWFVTSYYPNRQTNVFTLEPANSSNGMVKITYTLNETVLWSAIGCYIKNVTLGACSTQDGRLIVISLPSLEGCKCALAAHELGHVLGLNDFGLNGYPLLPQDLMNYNNTPDAYPSTLDLYAVYLIAFVGATSGGNFTLPSTIPYTHWTPGMTPVPEFPNILLVFASTMLLLVIVRRRIVSARPS